MRGIEGLGLSSRVHTSRVVSQSSDLPVAVIVVDSAERIDALPEVGELNPEELVIRDEVHVVSCRGREPGET